jgi:pimeloyl-ACP methyl ester carboxylesterase
MATGTHAWTEEFVEVAGVKLQMVRGGSGTPLLILHDEFGHHGQLRYHDVLAQEHSVYIPSHPGFGATERQDWVMNIRDLAGWYLEAIDDLGLGQANLMGFSLGGWLAAEMASMSPDLFNKLVLVGPAGIRPPTGEIFDMFLVVAEEYLTTGVHDPENTPEFSQICPEEPSAELAEAWAVAREEACRLSWRPYMHYLGFPNLVHRLKRVPTQIIWGREDNIVPVSAGQAYHDSIPGSRLDILEGCGHRPEIEKTDEFIGLVKQFLSS